MIIAWAEICNLAQQMRVSCTKLRCISQRCGCNCMFSMDQSLSTSERGPHSANSSNQDNSLAINDLRFPQSTMFSYPPSRNHAGKCLNCTIIQTSALVDSLSLFRFPSFDGTDEVGTYLTRLLALQLSSFSDLGGFPIIGYHISQHKCSQTAAVLPRYMFTCIYRIQSGRQLNISPELLDVVYAN